MVCAMAKAWRITKRPGRVTRRLAAAVVAIGLTTVVAPGVAHADGIRDDQWHLTALKIAEAHQRTQGGNVIVAVVDAGVDVEHQDLAGATLPAVGVNATGSTTRFDPDGRGTALAGVIAGQGHGANRDNGVLGVAPAARVLPVVIRPPAGSTPRPTVDPDLLARGIDLAVQRGAKVICVGHNVESSDRLRSAIDAALRADAIVVAADGNRQGEAFAPFPAAYPGVVAAVPLTRDGTVAVASGSGRRLGIGVPGQDIMTTNTGGGYRVDGGIAATGILAGAVALVRAAYPDLPADEIVNRLTATALDLGAPGLDQDSGFGSLDLLAALVRAVPPLRQPSPSANPSATPAPSAGAGAPPATEPHRRGPLGWLVALPLVAVLLTIAWYAVRAERRLLAGRDAG